ncbi:MAG TPA: hypothetical protein ENN91_05175, partial [Firmicutes bacterium]|nr:hypothetical protein [Bacillota bacterium]
MFKSIRRRMIIYNIAVIAVIVVIMGFFFSWFLHYFYMQTLRDNLYIQARLTAALIEEMINDETFPAVVDSLYEDLGAELGLRMTLINGEGVVLADSDENPALMENHADRPEIIEALQQEVGIARRYSETLEKDMYYLAVPFGEIDDEAGEGAHSLIIRLALPLSAINRA